MVKFKKDNQIKEQCTIIAISKNNARAREAARKNNFMNLHIMKKFI